MPTVFFSLSDRSRRISAKVSERVAESLVGTLSADPETIEEFEWAMGRFFHPDFGDEIRSHWLAGNCFTENGQSSISVDLPGRFIATRRDWPPEMNASLFGRNGQELAEHPYDLSETWSVVRSECERHAESGRGSRRRTPVDLREILYGQHMIGYLAEQCQRALAEDQPQLSKDWFRQRRDGWFRSDDDIYSVARNIHRNWLLSTLSETDGQPLRSLMLSERKHVATDLSHRTAQWAMQGECPIGLRRTDTAFRLGGMGAHELILYYDLIRELLFTYLENSIQEPGWVRDGFQQLCQRRDDWLRLPQLGMLVGYSPNEVIERERLRLPLVEPNGDDLFDADCPVCRMSVELGLGPAFVYLDDIHFDDEFVFSIHIDEAEWQRDQAENAVRYSEPFNQAEPEDKSASSQTGGIWQRVYVNDELLGRSANEDVMAIGFFLAELVEDVRRRGKQDELIDQLNLSYERLVPVARSGADGAANPVVMGLGAVIDDVAQQWPDLEAKCLDLQDRLAKLAELM